MCRWLAYSGSPIALEIFLLEPEYSLIDQSQHARMLRALYQDNPRLDGVTDEARLIGSEPLSDLAGVWNEIPEASCGVVQAGEDELQPFRPTRK